MGQSRVVGAIFAAGVVLLIAGFITCSEIEYAGSERAGVGIDGVAFQQASKDVGGSGASALGHPPPPAASDVGRGSRRESGAAYGPVEAHDGRPALRFLGPEGEGVRAMVLIGAPGTWPPKSRTADRRGVVPLTNLDALPLVGGTPTRLEILARSISRSLAFWNTISIRSNGRGGSSRGGQVRLQPASTVRIRVIGPDRGPRPDARVRVTRGALGLVSLSKHTGPEGRVAFRAIPKGRYTVSAELPGSGRAEANVRHPGHSESELELPLTGGRVRTQPLAEAEPTAEPPEPGVGDKGTGASPRESESESVPDLEEEEPFEPTTVRVRLDGLEGTAWRSGSARWRPEGAEWRLATLQPTGESGAKIWRKRISEPKFELSFRTEDGRSDSETFDASDERSFEWTVDLEAELELYVVDAYGVPVRGARVQVWQNGVRIASASSRGPRAVELSVPGTGDLHLVAFESRTGETHRKLSGTAGGEIVLELSDPLFSVDHPPERVTDRGRLEEIFGIPVLVDAGSWRIDGADASAPAIRAGLRQGDRLLTVRSVGEGWTVLYERDGSLKRTRIGDD